MDHAPDKMTRPWGQRLLDSILLLLAAGFLVPTLFYVAWGLVDLTQVPVFNR